MKTTTLELTKVELNYLYNLVCENIERGEYWGNQNQFMKMQERVFNKLMDCETEVTS
jgi:hypothetical protein